MNRSYYFNYIENKLNSLSYRIKVRGKINLLDLNIYSETFFADLSSLLLHYNLKNINLIRQNTEGIDLIDDKNKIFAQVSSICTKQKIEKSLDKKILKNYPSYKFKFFAIAGDASKLRNCTFKNPNGVIFVPSDDIYDIASLLNIVLHFDIKELRKVYELLRDELGNPMDMVKVDTNLASIINILSKEDLTNVTISLETNKFEIERKIEFNSLQSVQPIIKEHKIFYGRLNEKYKEFDMNGANKSFSVLSIMKNQYLKLSAKTDDPNEIFYSIIEYVIELTKNSKNYTEIPYEELEMCASILVVDAFIRCKIFKNPPDYNHVVTR